jgi:hypothetical protein
MRRISFHDTSVVPPIELAVFLALLGLFFSVAILVRLGVWKQRPLVQAPSKAEVLLPVQCVQVRKPYLFPTPPLWLLLICFTQQAHIYRSRKMFIRL